LTFILLPLVLSSNLAMFEIRLLGYICGFTTVNHYRCKGSGPCINYTSHTLQQLTTGLLFLFSNDFCTQVWTLSSSMLAVSYWKGTFLLAGRASMTAIWNYWWQTSSQLVYG